MLWYFIINFSFIDKTIRMPFKTSLTLHPFLHLFNSLRPRQNGCRFADETFKRIFLNENVRISIKISLKFVPKGPIDNNPALFQIMAWRRSGDKPLSEPMMVGLLMHICVTRPQWVKCYVILLAIFNYFDWPLNSYSKLFQKSFQKHLVALCSQKLWLLMALHH